MHRAIPILLALVFGISVGSFAYRTHAPLQSSEYAVGGELAPYELPADTQGGGKSMYLRREVLLPRVARHAWLEVLVQDVASVYINGKMAGAYAEAHPYNAGAILLDITPMLHPGKNLIAIATAQRSHYSPAVYVDGEVRVSDGHPISLKGNWRCAEHFQRGATSYWFEPEFDDSEWPEPVIGEPRPFRSQIITPPGSIRRPPTVQWIAPPGSKGGQGVVRRDFQLADSPENGWLRIQTTAPFRLSINGSVIYDDHEELAAELPFLPRFYIFDVSPRLRRGHNHIAMTLQSHSETPHLAADFEVTDKSGKQQYWETDGQWIGAAGAPTDWLSNETGTGWRECRAEVGSINNREMRAKRYFANARYRMGWFSRQTVNLAAWSAAATVIAVFAAWGVGAVLRMFAPRMPWSAPFAALAVPAAGCLAAMLLTYDNTITQRDVYQTRWLVYALGVLGAQWGMMLVAAMTMGNHQLHREPTPRRTSHRFTTISILIVLVSVGVWLRTRDLLLEPMHHDEVGAYFFTTSIFELGFPGGRIHPEMPFGYCATSELVYYFNAPFTLLFDDARLVIRVPAVIWSVYTLILMFFVSRSLFGLPTAVFASTIYCISPYLVCMANFGRYFSQLQFFALLCCYAYYRTIEGHGPINRKWLWFTAITFLAMYFSWEGSGFMAIGMIVAALIHRRGNLKSMLLCPQVYAAIVVVGSGILAQNSHRTLQQTRRLWFGTGISDVSVMPMWKYPRFDLLFYVREATWITDAAVPLFCALGILFLAVRHPRKQPIRVFLTIFLVTTLAMVMLLPLRATRYAYHMTPLLLIMSSALITTIARSVAKLGRQPGAPEWSRLTAGVSATLVGLIMLVVCSGYWGQLQELSGYRTAAYRPDLLKFPHWDRALRYLRNNMKEGDGVIAIYPHIVNMTMNLAKDDPIPEGWMTDYWMQSVMVQQATLSDASTLPLDRRTGARMIGDRESLQRVFDKHPRVWYLTIRHSHNGINHSNVSELARREMDIVYEDRATVVMLRDRAKNRTLEATEMTEEAAELGRTWVLK